MYDLIRKLEAIVLLDIAMEELERAQKQKKPRRKRRWSIRPLYQNRNVDSTYSRLVIPMRVFDAEKHHEYFRLDRTRFDELLELIKPLIQKKNTHSLPIPPEVRLTIALRFIATRQSFADIGFCFCMHRCTVRQIVYEVLEALVQVLRPYMKKPTREDWLKSAELYDELWQFPHCVGAVDGKMVKIKGPRNATSDYYCYKNFHAINLMACCAADYSFLAINVGRSGRHGDGTVFSESNFVQLLEAGRVNWPEPQFLPGTRILMPFVLVTDEGFALTPYQMRPYPRNRSGRPLELRKAVFNERLSRARRMSENTFAMLCALCGCLGAPLEMDVDRAALVVTACCYLHQYLIKTDYRIPLRERYVTVIAKLLAKPELETPAVFHSNNYSKKAAAIRDAFKDYFNDVYTLDHQWAAASRGRELPPVSGSD